MEVTDVLSMVIRIGGIGVLVYIGDIVEEILVQLDKWNLNEEIVERLSMVLESVVFVAEEELKNSGGTNDKKKEDDSVLEEWIKTFDSDSKEEVPNTNDKSKA